MGVREEGMSTIGETMREERADREPERRVGRKSQRERVREDRE